MPSDNKPERIMGIDPGLGSTGIGIIEADSDGWKIVHSSDVTTSSNQKMPDRLMKIYDLVEVGVRKYRPGSISIESVFFAKNVKSAVQMAHGRGVAILAAHQSGVQVHEYSPLEIKQSVVGKGRASKEQVMKMVSIILDLDVTGYSDHRTDALACALAHAYRKKLQIAATNLDSESGEVSANKLLLAQSKQSRKSGRRRR